MSEPNTGWQAALALLRQVDWPSALHKATVMIRELRGDSDQIDRDSMRVRGVGTRTKETIEQLGRKAVGCVAPAPCECAFCKEGKAP